ncbi:MAG: hypothetical protein IJM18_05885 [Clostridia bacterium]|nr:hypothetical protein [Clostridia bacterium]
MAVNKKRKLNPSARRWLRRLIALGILIGLIGAIALGASAIVRSCRTSLSKRSLPFSKDTGYAFTGDGFLYTGDKTLDYLSLSDESKSFSTDADAAGAHVAGTDQIKVVYGASSLQIIGTPYEHSFEGGIKKVVCGGKYAGVYVENADNSHSLMVYNSAGDCIKKLDVGSSVLLDFGFEGGSSAAMFTSELVITGSAVSTTVTTFDLARESMTGVLNVSGEVAKNVFLTGKSVFVFATDYLIRYDRGGNTEAYRLLVRGYDCEDFCPNDGKAYFLLSKGDSSEPMRVLEVRESASADDKALELANDTDAKAVFVMRGKVVAVKEDRIVVRDMNGNVKANLSHGIKAEAAERLDGTRLLIFEGGEAVLFTLKNL